MSKTKTTFAALGALALLVALSIGGYQLHWWMRGQEVNRSAQINQDSYGRQNSLVEAIVREATDLAQPGLPDAQRKALVTEMCVNAAKLTSSIQLPLTVQTLIAQECA
jgi:hypothetical protein